MLSFIPVSSAKQYFLQNTQINLVLSFYDVKDIRKATVKFIHVARLNIVW